MRTIEIDTDIKLNLGLFRKYYNYERKKVLTRFPYLLLFLLSTLIFLIGLILEIKISFYFGIIMSSIIVLFLLYVFISYRFYYLKFERDYKKSFILSEKQFTFSFNDKEISYTSANSNRQIKWNLIKSFEENDGDLYLYLEDKSLLDIISKSIMGKDAYKDFKEIVQQVFSKANAQQN